MSWRNRVEVSYSALRQNVQALKQWIGTRKLIAVGKADAYGLGLERCARIYHDAGADVIAVAALAEADRVRKTAPMARVMLLGSPLPEERSAVAASNYEVWVSSEVEVTEYAALAETYPGIKLHLAVDTGMGRAGCRPDQAVELARRILEHPGLELAGLCSHYPMALDPTGSEEQDRIFATILETLAPGPDCLVHLANSEGALVRREGPGNAVRCGLVLTGVLPDDCPDPGLRLAVRWVSSLSLVKELPAGHSISYNRTAVLDRDSLVALVPVGYADGYPWRGSGRAKVLVQGRACPILGRVTMDYLVVDCSDLPRQPVVGEEVVLLGGQGEAEISVQDLAATVETIPYDILCGLRGRCEVVGVH